MMKSLKRGSKSEVKVEAEPSKREEGELVTRADGSKALKVRSRKRRSTQPRKEKERKATRNKIIVICSGIFLLLMLGITFVFTLAYYNGNKFKEKLVTTGSIKFDITISDQTIEQSKALRGQLGVDRPIWIAASTHKGEDEQVLAAHAEVLKQHPNALLLLVPRHPERFDEVFELCKSFKFTSTRRTSNEAFTAGASSTEASV